MDIEYKKIELARTIIDELPEIEIERIIKKFELEDWDVEDAESMKDWLFEDYGFTLPVLKYLLKKKGITTMDTEDYCESCDDYSAPMTFDMKKGTWTCKKCGNTNKETYDIWKGN